jgi:hypothetical protein
MATSILKDALTEHVYVSIVGIIIDYLEDDDYGPIFKPLAPLKDITETEYVDIYTKYEQYRGYTYSNYIPALPKDEIARIARQHKKKEYDQWVTNRQKKLVQASILREDRIAFQWAVDQHYPINNAVLIALKYGKHDMTLWIMKITGYIPDDNFYWHFVTTGDLEFCKKLHVEGYSLYEPSGSDQSRYIETALDVITHKRQLGIVSSENNIIELLQWCYYNNVWCELITNILAVNGSIVGMQWARERACPWNYMSRVLAQRCNHGKLLLWMMKNGYTH